MFKMKLTIVLFVCFFLLLLLDVLVLCSTPYISEMARSRGRGWVVPSFFRGKEHVRGRVLRHDPND
jgi:hypothetical protein